MFGIRTEITGNVENENEKVETFAKEHGFDIVGEIPRSDEINRCEDQGRR